MQTFNCNNKTCIYNTNYICTKDNVQLNCLGECTSKEINNAPGHCTTCKNFRLSQNYGDPVLRQICLKNNQPNLWPNNSCWE